MRCAFPARTSVLKPRTQRAPTVSAALSPRVLRANAHLKLTVSPLPNGPTSSAASASTPKPAPKAVADQILALLGQSGMSRASMFSELGLTAEDVAALPGRLETHYSVSFGGRFAPTLSTTVIEAGFSVNEFWPAPAPAGHSGPGFHALWKAKPGSGYRDVEAIITSSASMDVVTGALDRIPEHAVRASLAEAAAKGPIKLDLAYRRRSGAEFKGQPTLEDRTQSESNADPVSGLRLTLSQGEVSLLALDFVVQHIAIVKRPRS